MINNKCVALALVAAVLGGFGVGLHGQAPPGIPSVPVRPMVPPFTPVPPAVSPDYGQYAYFSAGPSPYSDTELRRSIQNQMAADTFLRRFGIHVEVREGVAVLTGTADTWQDYMRAEADAYAAGVSVVDNRLRVRFG